MNRLYCSGCKCPRSLYQYPLTWNGYRTATCVSCHERWKQEESTGQPRGKLEQEGSVSQPLDLFTGQAREQEESAG